MALDTNTLKVTLIEKILQALNAPISNESNSDEVKNAFATAVATAVAEGVDVWNKDRNCNRRAWHTSIYFGRSRSYKWARHWDNIIMSSYKVDKNIIKLWHF